MQFNVVARIIAGFVLMAVLLLIASISSYIGLSSIRHAAESVVEEKMPVQQQMLTIQTEILKMGKHSLAGFHSSNMAQLSSNHKEFLQLKDEFEKNIQSLKQLIRNSALNNDFDKAWTASSSYVSATQSMYQLRIDVLNRTSSIQEQIEQINLQIDDSGAFLLDLAFLDGAETEQGLIALVGTGTGIDNALQSLKNATRDYVAIDAVELNKTVIGDIEYAISVLDSQVEYLQQSSEGINTDGIVDEFIAQYALLKSYYFGESGILQTQANKVDVLANSIHNMNSSEEALELSIDLFNSLFDIVNKSTLDGQQKIIGNVHANILIGFGVLAFGLLSVVVIGYLIARNISKPLEKIKRSLSLISDGDLTHKADDSTSDEFGLLASKVNDLSASLHMIVEKILNQEHALKKTTQVSVQLGEENIKQAGVQFEQINATVKNTTQVRETSAQNLDQIESGSQDLLNVSKQINQVGELIQQSQQQIVSQATQAKDSAITINSLEQNSKRIGSILDVIKNIAEQTNLLALNAAIEAARAGEHGRGFAVVADEVRTLATRTQSSTAEIEQMIMTLQGDAQKAVTAIEAGQKETDQSVELIDTVNQQIVEILKVVSELTKMNQNIVHESRDQDALLSKVGSDLEEVVVLAKQSGVRTEKRNQVTQEMESLMQQLSETVSRFKV